MVMAVFAVQAAAKKDVPKKEDAKKKGNPKTQGSIMNFFAKK